MLPLVASRVILRRFEPDDLAAFHAYRNDPEVARWQSWDGIGLADAVAFIARMQTLPEGTPGAWLQIAIADRASAALLGDAALRIDADDPRQADLGITLARTSQGKGYAAEALTCLFDHLFLGPEPQLHRIRADTDPANRPSQRLLERLSMRREGHLVGSLWFKGQWADELLYAILREEWVTRRG